MKLGLGDRVARSIHQHERDDCGSTLESDALLLCVHCGVCMGHHACLLRVCEWDHSFGRSHRIRLRHLAREVNIRAASEPENTTQAPRCRLLHLCWAMQSAWRRCLAHSGRFFASQWCCVSIYEVGRCRWESPKLHVVQRHRAQWCVVWHWLNWLRRRQKLWTVAFLVPALVHVVAGRFSCILLFSIPTTQKIGPTTGVAQCC